MNNLAKALDCEDEEFVIKGFIERYNVSQEEAKDIFDETKKWLWLVNESGKQKADPVFIDRPLMIIDEMWHTFILNTTLYYKFCLKHFKNFIHHIPTTADEKKEFQKRIAENPEGEAKRHQKMVENQYNLIYDSLGPDTLVKWYDTFAQKYTPNQIRSLKKSNSN